MDLEMLKEYTNKAKELEAAIYTQKQLMATHKEIMEKRAPNAPTKKQYDKPQEPKREDYVSEPPKLETDALGGAAIVAVIGFFLASVASGVSAGITFIIILATLAISGFIAWSVYSSYRDSKDHYQGECYKFDKAAAEYPKLLEQYNKNIRQANERYQAEQAQYYTLKQQHNDSSRSIMARHDKCLAELQQALNNLYAAKVIFPKYQNFVAISAISEYLSSGRCYSLEGPDGAYNLYEMELRQNIVIGQLSNIVSNLEQIRSNQYSLYEELTESNRTVQAIASELRTLNNTAKLDAYFNAVSAKAAISPRIITGIIH